MALLAGSPGRARQLLRSLDCVLEFSVHSVLGSRFWSRGSCPGARGGARATTCGASAHPDGLRALAPRAPDVRPRRCRSTHRPARHACTQGRCERPRRQASVLARSSSIKLGVPGSPPHGSGQQAVPNQQQQPRNIRAASSLLPSSCLARPGAQGSGKLLIS